MNREDNQAGYKLPIAINEDVEYSEEIADADDREAVQRAEQADLRTQKKKS